MPTEALRCLEEENTPGCLTFLLHPPPKDRCPECAELNWNRTVCLWGAVSCVAVDAVYWESTTLLLLLVVFLKNQQIMQFHTWLFSWVGGNVFFWASTVKEPKARGQLLGSTVPYCRFNSCSLAWLRSEAPWGTCAFAVWAHLLSFPLWGGKKGHKKRSVNVQHS